MDYVLGFALNAVGDRVLLINKLKPEWQRNHLNGIGGKIESGEFPIQAMVREFQEETGIETEAMDWNEVCVFHGKQENWNVHVFKTHEINIYDFTDTTEEQCRICDVHNLPSNVIANLRWVIPMCFDNDVQTDTIINFR